MGTTALTAWLRRRIAEAARGHGRRGAQPPPRVRCRGGPGADDPSQQGPRVPDRLPARSSGSPATSRRATSPCSSTTPTPATHATIDVALEGPDSRATSSRPSSSSAARTFASPTSRSRARDTRRSSGGRAPGTAELAARPAALRTRRRRQRRAPRAAPRPDDAAAVERFEALAAAGARPHQRRALDARAARRLDAARDRTRGARRRRLRPQPRPALAAHLLQRHHRRHLRAHASPASRRRPPSSTSPTPRCRRADRGASRSTRRCATPSLLGRHAGRARSRDPRAPACSRRRTSPPPTSTPSSRRSSAAALAPARSTSAIPTPCVAGLRAAIETPLGPLRWRPSPARRRRTDRLDELEFELPLAGGDDPTGELTLDAIADVLREHLAAGDPLAGYATRLEDPAPPPERPRLPHGQHRPRAPTARTSRFAVVDYKTNWLGGAGRAADRLALPAGGARGRDAARPLRPAGAPVHRRPSPLPALAPPRLRPRAQPRRRPLPLPARDARPGHARRRRDAVRGLRVEAAEPHWSRASATSSTDGAPA